MGWPGRGGKKRLLGRKLLTVMSGPFPRVRALLFFLVLEQLLDLMSHMQKVIVGDLAVLQLLTGLSEQVSFANRIQHLWYLQISIHAETMRFGGAWGGGPPTTWIGLGSLRCNLSLLQHLHVFGLLPSTLPAMRVLLAVFVFRVGAGGFRVPGLRMPLLW